jgi:hypothetical protein
MNNFQKNDFHLVLGRPATGKTKYLLDLVQNTPSQSFVYFSASKLSKYYADALKFKNLVTCIYPARKELFLDLLNKQLYDSQLILLLDDLHFLEEIYGDLSSLKNFEYPIYAASMTDKSRYSYAKQFVTFADSIIHLDREQSDGN